LDDEFLRRTVARWRFFTTKHSANSSIDQGGGKRRLGMIRRRGGGDAAGAPALAASVTAELQHFKNLRRTLASASSG